MDHGYRIARLRGFCSVDGEIGRGRGLAVCVGGREAGAKEGAHKGGPYGHDIGWEAGKAVV